MTKKITSIVLVLVTLFTIGSVSFTADAATKRTLSVSANKYSGTTSDTFYFYASTNFSAKKVTLKVDNSSKIYNMSSYRYSSNKNWSSTGISLSQGTRTISIRAYYNTRNYISRTLKIQVTKPIKLTLSVSANKYSGTTDDSFDFYATTNFSATKVTLKFNNNSNTHSMSSSDKKNWSLCGNHLSAGNRTITITAYSGDGQTVTKSLSITVKQAPTVFLQNDPSWADVPYGYKDKACKEPATISSSGCGLLSITNAVYYLTGKFIEPTDLAKLSLNNGYRINGEGTAWAFAEFAAKTYGNSCGFKFVGESYYDSDLIAHLKSGGVSVAVVPNHFVAMVAYDVSSDKILVLDSAPGGKRPSTAATWIDSNELKSGCFQTYHYSFFSSATSNSPITPVPTKLTLSVSANKYSGTTDDSFDFYATTNIPATKVTLKFNNNSTTHSMSSSNKKNWSLCGNHLSAGNRTITITAYSSDGQTATKTLNVTVTEKTTITLSVSANKYSGTTDDSFDFYATTNIPATKVTLNFNNNSKTYSMGSSNQKNWSLCGNHLSAGNRTITITAYSSDGQTITKKLNVTVTEKTTMTLSVSANKYSGTTDDSFDFYATTNIPATKVTLKFNNNSTTYSMGSSNQKNWSLCGNHLSAGNRTITITAYSSDGQTATKTLNVNVTEIAYPSKDITVNYKYYKDVPSNHWAHKYVCAASYYGLVQGVGNDEFDPDSPIKYAHFISVLNKINYVGSINNYNSISRTDAVVWLWQAAGCPSAPMNLLDNKTDANLLIDTDSKYAWSWCMQYNIVNGYEDGTLRPNNTISRAEAAAIFVRYYCLEKEGFRVNNIYVV